MKIEEIITNPPRDEYLDNKILKFQNAQTVAKIKDLILKKSINNSEFVDEIYYGLFDSDNRLISYLSLDHHKDNIWRVILVQLAQAYKRQGYSTFLYDYAVMNDKLYLLSDETNTGGPYGSRNL